MDAAEGDYRVVVRPAIYADGWHWEVQRLSSGTWVRMDSSIEVVPFKFLAAWLGGRALKRALKVEKKRGLKSEVVKYHRHGKTPGS